MNLAFHWLTCTGRVPHGGEAVFQWENTHMLTLDTWALERTSFAHCLLSSCPLSEEYSRGCCHWWTRHLTVLMSFPSNPPCSSHIKFPSVAWYGDGRKSDHTLKKTKDGRKNKVEWDKSYHRFMWQIATLCFHHKWSKWPFPCLLVLKTQLRFNQCILNICSQESKDKR